MTSVYIFVCPKKYIFAFCALNTKETFHTEEQNDQSFSQSAHYRYSENVILPSLLSVISVTFGPKLCILSIQLRFAASISIEIEINYCQTTFNFKLRVC